MKYLILSLLSVSLLSATSFAFPSLTNATFDQAVNNAPLSVVNFSVQGCGASARFHNVLLDFAQDNPSVAIYSVDADAERFLADDFNVQVYPTTYVFRYGRRIFGFSGVASESFLVNKINSHR